MKTKSFQKYLEQRLDKEEIAEIKRQAELEYQYLKSFQTMITRLLEKYMKEHKIGFNDLVRKLNWSPTKVAKIKRGEANVTLASLAHIFALLETDPQDVFIVR